MLLYLPFSFDQILQEQDRGDINSCQLKLFQNFRLCQRKQNERVTSRTGLKDIETIFGYKASTNNLAKVSVKYLLSGF